MDLLSIRPDSIEVPIHHPGTRKPLGLILNCVSLEDDRVKTVERQLKNRALRGGRNSITAESVDDNTLAILCATVVGWTWPESLSLGDLSNPDCNKENIKKLLSLPWVASQVDTAVGDEASFFLKQLNN